MITKDLSTLKIHKLTQEQFDRELAAGNLEEDALYLTPDEEIDLSDYATKEYVDSAISSITPEGEGQETLVITIDEETMTSNHSSTEIEAAYNAGRYIIAKYNSQNFVYHSTSVGIVLLFCASENGINNILSINEDKAVEFYVSRPRIDNITAAVGQMAIVKEVNEEGRPITWEAADVPAPESTVIDDTLSIEGQAADAKAVGEALATIPILEQIISWAVTETSTTVNIVLTTEKDNYTHILDFDSNGNLKSITVNGVVISGTWTIEESDINE